MATHAEGAEDVSVQPQTRAALVYGLRKDGACLLTAFQWQLSLLSFLDVVFFL